MKRHPFDPTSFIFGVVLAAAGVGFFLADQLAWDVDGRWVLPAALIVLGIAGVAGAVAGLRPSRSERPDAKATDAEATGPDDTGSGDTDVDATNDRDSEIGSDLSPS